jgi:hypothetical protein
MAALEAKHLDFLEQPGHADHVWLAEWLRVRVQLP